MKLGTKKYLLYSYIEQDLLKITNKLDKGIDYNIIEEKEYNKLYNKVTEVIEKIEEYKEKEEEKTND